MTSLEKLTELVDAAMEAAVNNACETTSRTDELNATSTRTTLLTALAAVVRDAERYRWLRTRINWRDCDAGISTSRTAPVMTYTRRDWTHSDVRPARDRPDSEHIDDYLDAAIKASGEGKP